MVILRTRNKIIDFLMILAWASPFNYNGKFTEANKQLVVKGNRAMFLLLRKCRQLQLPVDIQLELFDILVKPILLYGCEV